MNPSPIRYDEALARTIAVASPLGKEQVALGQAHGRILAAPIVARIDAPRADVSAMDGYAVRDADLADGAPLRIAGVSRPGHPFPEPLPERACVRIFTGAAVPAGADRVIIQEQVEREANGNARLPATPGRDRHIRTAGSDFARGAMLLAAGTRLGPGALVAAAGADVASVIVHRRPRVALIATGDELVEPGTALGRTATIPDSATAGVAAMVAEAGADVTDMARLPDELVALRAAAGEALRGADVVVVTGGASVGERDFARAMFEPHGLELLFSRVAMKPGKPVWLGRAGALVIGLPGNPGSALVTARLLLVPLLLGLGGRAPDALLHWRRLPLAAPLGPTGERETFSRGFEAGGCAHLFGHQDSGAQKVLADATLLVRRPPGDRAVPAGTAVDVLDF